MYGIQFIVAGALGALAADILIDNKIQLPKKVNNDLILGSLGGMLIGALAGYWADGSVLAAFSAGFGGTEFISNLVNKETTTQPQEKSIEQTIRKIAKEEGVDPDLAVRVAKCENAKLDPKAINVNKDGSKDRGLFQINDKWHPEVSDEQAFDPIFSTRFFCKAFKEGHLNWWNASRNCWKKE
jgi:hypothetical protein